MSAATSETRRVMRYTLTERIVHWVAGFSYVYLLLSGLAFYSPHLFWLAAILGGGQTARFWHPIFGVAFAGTVLRMYQIWSRDMRITDVDRAWSREMGHYIRNEDENLPPIGRFNYGQKQLFWLMFYGGMALLLTGLVMWFPELIPWKANWLKLGADFLHTAFALLTIGGFIIHVYMGTAVVRGGYTSIIRGEVSESWARHHHKLWLDEVNAETKK